MIRSKSNWIENGKKPSKLFFALEKMRSRNKSIQKLLVQHPHAQDQLLETNKVILQELKIFYSNLFNEHEVDTTSDFLNDLKLPQISPEDKLILEAPLSLDEIDIAVRQLVCDKCPGPDGLSINFMRKFWPQIKHTLHSMYLRAINDGEFATDTRTGVISLMEKLHKNPLNLTNWRQLSMLNSDYKVYAKAVANQLQLVLPRLINRDQVGFMKGRQIAQNLTELLTVIDYCSKNNSEAIITSVDFEKAFDVVSWKAMTKVMQAFGFGPKFIEMVMLCYKNFEVTIGNNGHFTEPIKIRRGNKQGCPLSALNFLLMVETVGAKL